MNEFPRTKLVEIINKNGINIVYEKFRIRNFLNDLCGEYILEKNILLTAMDHDIPDTLLSSSDVIPKEITIDRLVNRIKATTGLSEEPARYAIESWAIALGMLPDSREDYNFPTSSRLNKTIPILPIPLSPSVTITKLDELPNYFDSNWEKALSMFIDGTLTKHILQSVKNLNITNRLEESKKLYEYYKKAKQYESNAIGSDVISQNLALEEFIQSIGDVQKPKLIITPSKIKLILRKPGENLTGRLSFTNNGRGYLYVEISTSNQLIHVSPSRFGCVFGSREIVNITFNSSSLKIDSDVDSLVYRLFIYSNIGEKTIPIKVIIGRPQIEISPSKINLGTIPFGQYKNHRLVITNSGEANLEGQIKSQVDWLKISSKHFDLEQGDQKEFKLSFYTKGLHKLKEGQLYFKDVEVISNCGSLKIPVIFKIGYPKIFIEKTAVNLGSIVKGRSIKEKILIENKGTAILQGKIVCEATWLRLSHKEFSCEPGNAFELIITPNTNSLLGSGDGKLYSDEIVFDTDREKKVLPVRIRVVVPKLKVIPSDLSIDLGSSIESVECFFIIKNECSLNLNINVYPTEKWLKLSVQNLTCQPHTSKKVKLNVIKEHLPQIKNENQISANVLIKSKSIKVELPVNLKLTPKLEVVPSSVKFSNLRGSKSDQIKLHITNSGEGLLSGNLISNESWLKINPKNFSCLPGQSIIANLQAELSDKLFRSLSGMVTINSNAGKKNISVQLPIVSMDKHVLKFHWAYDGSDTKKNIVISNYGIKEYRAKLKCPIEWVNISRSEIIIAPGQSRRIMVWVDFDLLGEYKEDTNLFVSSNNDNLIVDIKADGVSNPKYSSGNKWELISLDGKVLHATNPNELKNLLNEGCVLLNIN